MSTQDRPPSGAQRRLDDLASNITRDLDLLKEYEDALAFEDDPRRKARNRRAIEELRASASTYQAEYDGLLLLVSGVQQPQLHEVATQLRQLDAKIDQLLAGQADVQLGLDDLRMAVLGTFESERLMLQPIVGRLDVTELARVRSVLQALERGHIPASALEEALGATEQVVTTAAAPELSRLAPVLSGPTVDVKQKLKVSIPIIPFILSYEGELGMSSSGGLRALWDRLVALARG